MTKIAIAQIKVRAGRPDQNYKTMLDYCRRAHAEGAELVVFPELAMTGSFLGQAWNSPGILQECENYNRKLISATNSMGDMVVVFGSIGLMRDQNGNATPASAIYVAQTGRQISSPMGSFSAKVKGGQLDFALLTEQQQHPQAPLVIRLGTSFYLHDKTPQFHQSFAEFTKTYGQTLIYVNHVGVQDAGKPVYVYDGGSAVFAPNGEMIASAGQFEEKLVVVDTEHPGAAEEIAANDSVEVLYNGMVHAVREYSANVGITKAVVGLSGGVDSCVAACVAVAALGRENVLGINLPSKYNCDATKEIAAKLAENLGIRYEVLSIQQAVDERAAALAAVGLPLDDKAMENVQARERGAGMLSAAAAAFGGAVICCANKSELTVGYSTMYGDAVGYLAPLGDLWKCQVYEVARHIYENGALIPLAALEINPSAELSENQSIEAGLGDPLCYAYHDYLFRSWVEWGQDIADTLTYYNDGRLAEIIGCGTEQLAALFPTRKSFMDDLEHWWGLFKGLAVAKRLQAPPVLSLSRRAFGSDLPESQTGCWLDGEYLRLKARVLARDDKLTL